MIGVGKKPTAPKAIRELFNGDSFHNSNFKFGRISGFNNTYFAQLNPHNAADLTTLTFVLKGILREQQKPWN